MGFREKLKKIRPSYRTERRMNEAMAKLALERRQKKDEQRQG